MFNKLDFKLIIVPLLIGLFSFSGCSVGRGVVEVKMPATGEISSSNSKEVYINSVVDERVFEVKPKSANIPSLDPDAVDNETIKPRAIGRKRNSWGKALGDIVLPNHQTVSSVIKDATKQAFLEDGYKVIDSKKNISDKTYIADITVNQFWSWMQPGAWSLSLNTEIATHIKLKKDSSVQEEAIFILSSENYQSAVTGNWIEVMDIALKNYINKVKSRY